jgi:hypothetical protein
MPHRNWFSSQPKHSIDKKGLAVALAFLAIISFMASGSDDGKTRQDRFPQPIVSDMIVSDEEASRVPSEARSPKTIEPMAVRVNPAPHTSIETRNP